MYYKTSAFHNSVGVLQVEIKANKREIIGFVNWLVVLAIPQQSTMACEYEFYSGGTPSLGGVNMQYMIFKQYILQVYASVIVAIALC